ncbi:unnamed protein product [Ilex paraguariensis]|uniref:PUM-HD domain-containing protein n=1 Tax=Ilex paraguariensis TaxID=185542 RepID=A0ABC8SBJ1_9AQUA
MKGGEGELEMLVKESAHMTSLNHRFHQNGGPMLKNVSPICLDSLSAGFGTSSGVSSPSVTPFHETMYRTPSTTYSDSLVFKNSDEQENRLDELGLSDNLCKIHIGNERNDLSGINRFGLDPNNLGFGFRAYFSNAISPCNVEHYCPIEGFGSDDNVCGGFQSSVHGHSGNFDDDMKVTLLGLQHGYNVGSSMVCQSNALYSGSNLHRDQIDYLVELRKEQGRDNCKGRIELPSPSTSRHYLNDGFYCSQNYGIEGNGDRSVLNALQYSQLMRPKLPLTGETPTYNCSMLNEKSRAMPNTRNNNVGGLEVFSYEDNFIIEGKSLNCVANKKCDRPKGQKKNSPKQTATQGSREKKPAVACGSLSRGVCDNGLSHGEPGKNCGNGLRPRTCSATLLQPTCSPLTECREYIFYMAKDQFGCRFLQRIFDEGSLQDVQTIFNEIINHVIELMVNQFGNYLMQKLLDVCSEEQRTQIVLMVTKEPGELVRISLNSHGTRVVQKLIETLKTRQQISLVILALEPGFLDLIKDLNGNHVVQRCLQCLREEHNKHASSNHLNEHWLTAYLVGPPQDFVQCDCLS